MIGNARKIFFIAYARHISAHMGRRHASTGSNRDITDQRIYVTGAFAPFRIEDCVDALNPFENNV